MKWYYCPWAEDFVGYLDRESFPSVPCKLHPFEHYLTDSVDEVMRLKCGVCQTSQIVPEDNLNYFEPWSDLGPAEVDDELSGDTVIFRHEGLCGVCANSPV